MKCKILLSAVLALCNLLALYSADVFLAGNESGLYEISVGGVKHIWGGAAVYKIVKAADRRLFLTDRGIAVTDDLKTFSFLNASLPKKIVKHIDEKGSRTFVEKMPQLKDLEVHPSNPDIFVTASSSKVFLTTDGGKSWQDLGANGVINGIKAVNVLDLPRAKAG